MLKTEPDRKSLSLHPKAVRTDWDFFFFAVGREVFMSFTAQPKLKQYKVTRS